MNPSRNVNTATFHRRSDATSSGWGTGSKACGGGILGGGARVVVVVWRGRERLPPGRSNVCKPGR